MNVRTLVGVALVAGVSVLTACTDGGDEKVVSASAPVSPGEAIYKKNCKVCHAQGLNGAPIVGNKAMWGPRVAQGADVLVEHAVNGFGLMPPKGGQTHLSDAEIRLVVEYYISQVQ